MAFGSIIGQLKDPCIPLRDTRHPKHILAVISRSKEECGTELMVVVSLLLGSGAGADTVTSSSQDVALSRAGIWQIRQYSVVLAGLSFSDVLPTVATILGNEVLRSEKY